MQRILALDVGEKRIGLAVSDPLGITAQGLETYQRTGDLDRDTDYIIRTAEKYRPVRLLFGLPRNMDGSYGFLAEYVRSFADEVLKKWDGEYDFEDERLTTVSATRVLLEGDVSRGKRKKFVDKIAAVFILESYMGRMSR